jgi:hypothetical protein
MLPPMLQLPVMLELAVSSQRHAGSVRLVDKLHSTGNVRRPC